MIRRISEWLRARLFLKAVAILISGTGLAALTMAMTLPIITRLYRPEDFGAYALFISLLSILSVSICLRFDIAIPLPEEDIEAQKLLALSLISALVLSIALLLLLVAVPSEIIGILVPSVVQPFLWILPIAVFCVGSVNALQYWFIRAKVFSLISYTRATQALLASLLQIGVGLAYPHPLGLVSGLTLASMVSATVLGYFIYTSTTFSLAAITPTQLAKAFRRHKQFPTYSTLEALFNTAANQLPIVIIAAVAEQAEAGFLILSITIMQAPMGVLGTAISQAYVSRAPDESRAGTLDKFTAGILGALMRIGVGPILFGGVLAPLLAGSVFGQGWQRAGELMCWMTPWFIAQFLASPISMALHVQRRQDLAFALQALGFILRVGGIYAAWVYIPHLLTEAFAVLSFVFYATYLGVVLVTLGAANETLFREFKTSINLSAGWMLAALTFWMIWS